MPTTELTPVLYFRREMSTPFRARPKNSVTTSEPSAAHSGLSAVCVDTKSKLKETYVEESICFAAAIMNTWLTPGIALLTRFLFPLLCSLRAMDSYHRPHLVTR